MAVQDSFFQQRNQNLRVEGKIEGENEQAEEKTKIYENCQAISKFLNLKNLIYR